MNFSAKHLLTVLAFCTSVSLYSQSIPDSIVRKIDSIYKNLDTQNTPGFDVGIVMGDQLVFAKGYGLANLEYGLPNTPATIFHMASVSKQFAAWSIVLLARQGKLSLDDNIRKYLPWFKAGKSTITIRHLLNHTSGIRDQWELLSIAGTRLQDVITQEHIVKVLSRQQDLNFAPGEKYTYSNSGYTMLAEIVKAVTHQTLRQFTDSAIFKPLGMNATHFHDDCTEIEKNRSYSYERANNNAPFTNSILSYSNAGATSLFTNVNDMSQWVKNFYNHKVGDAQDIATLTTKGKLNSGKEISYACGIVVQSFMGWKEYIHDGSDAGYRTCVAVFPDLKMGFIVFSNLAHTNPSEKVHAMARLFMRDTTTRKEDTRSLPQDSISAVFKDTAALKPLLGDYISDEGLAVNVNIIRNKLYYHIFDESNFLLREGKDSFYIGIAPAVKFLFSSNKNGRPTLKIINGTQTYDLIRYKRDTAASVTLLKPYVGHYYCPELDCSYDIELRGLQLYLTNAKYDDVKITLYGSEQLSTEYWWMSHLKILRNTAHQIAGFEVNTGRVSHLKFIKTKREGM
ncbi:MAG: serine hydrolase domain-containing protein [Chitinophagaceae bacterium]